MTKTLIESDENLIEIWLEYLQRPEWIMGGARLSVSQLFLKNNFW
jgi:hypothetical protein